MRSYFRHPQIYRAVLALALGAGSATAAQAQTLTNRPLQLAPQPQTTITRTTVRESVVASPTKHRHSSKWTARHNVNHVQRSVAVQRKGRVIRTTTTERIVTRPSAQTDGLAAREVAPLRLTPMQRGVIYRDIVEQPVAPRTMVTRRIAPQAIMQEEPIVATQSYVEPAPVYVEPAPRIVPAPVVEETVAAPIVTVGERIPEATPLYVLPATTLADRPDLGGYRYAMIGGRTMLVDPASGVIVASLND